MTLVERIESHEAVVGIIGQGYVGLRFHFYLTKRASQ